MFGGMKSTASLENGSPMKMSATKEGGMVLVDPGHTTPTVPSLPIMGSVLFNDNQIAFTPGDNVGRAAISTLVVSRDDLVFEGNQSECVLQSQQLGVNTIVLGATTRVSNNAFRETLTTTTMSAVTGGILLNTTTGNHSTHCIMALGQPNGVVDQYNLSIVELYRGGLCSQFAVTREVSGRISYRKMGIAGVRVNVKDTSIRTETNHFGKYSLDVPEGDVVLVFKGPAGTPYSDIEVERTVPADESVLNIAIEDLREGGRRQ